MAALPKINSIHKTTVCKSCKSTHPTQLHLFHGLLGEIVMKLGDKKLQETFISSGNSVKTTACQSCH
eukprot:123700-Amphidinium_carterae.1